MKEIYQQMSIASSMPDLPSTAVMGDALYMVDNLDMTLIVNEEKKQSLLNNPIQLVSTMSLLVCFQGTIDVKIGLQAYKMQANDALFMKSGIICEVNDMSQEALFFSVALDEAFYYPIFSHMDMSILQRALIRRPICRLDEKCIDECKGIYRLMKKRLLENKDGSLHTEILKGYLQVLLFNVYEVYLRQDDLLPEQEKKYSRQQELFNRFMELLQRDYRKERNISHYASKLCVTQVYLSRVVLAQSGHTAREHIDNFIITEAKQLIRSKQYTILQISEMLNFTCQSFFGRYFKKHTGFTPTTYQNIENNVL